jgi:hypothetical protein
MPTRQLALLLGLFGLCLALVGLAWASGSELFLFVPTGHSRPPTHPGIILGLLGISPILTFWVRQGGVYVFILITLGILLGSVLGFKGFGWTPSALRNG